MAQARKSEPEKAVRRPPATTPQGRENQLIALAYDEAEKQIRSGHATSQLLTHFLKLGTEREKLERKRIQVDVSLGEAKVKSIESQENAELRYKEAMIAFKSYAGQGEEEFEDD